MMNDLMPMHEPQSPQPVSSAAVTTRAAQEVQAAVFMAKQYPRDQGKALKAIESACARPRLAEQALYSYPKGGQEITGPSIRLAEVLAQNWGNLRFGWKELERRNGESDVEAYCWDIETNSYMPLQFKVLHIRDTRKGPVVLLDQRDIYEHVANQAARRLRKCILSVIPGDVVEAAQEACEKTMRQAGTLAEKRDKIIAAFKEVDVGVEEIERRLAKKITALSDIDYIQLRKIWKSLKDGMSKKEDWFEPILDPEKIKKEQTEGAQTSIHDAQEMKREDAERQVAITELKVLATAIEAGGADPEAILGISVPYGLADASKYSANAINVMVDKLKAAMVKSRK